MGENAHTSHFNNTAQYSDYLAMINPNTPEVQSWDQIISFIDSVICPGSGSPTGTSGKLGGVICRISLFKGRPVISTLVRIQLQNDKLFYYGVGVYL